MLKIFLLALVLCGIAQSSLACAMLEHADPKVGSVISTPVDHVTLTFSGKIYPEKSTLEVKDAQGNLISDGKAYGDDTTLSVKLKSVGPGRYKVSWNTYCDCKSYTPGDYRFTVQ